MQVFSIMLFKIVAFFTPSRKLDKLNGKFHRVTLFRVKF